MIQPTEKGSLFGPRLVFEERSLPCGYAPRVLLVSQYAVQTVFVGCKDGSVSILTPDAGKGEERRPRRFRGEALGLHHFEVAANPPGAGSIRALCEFDEDHLLVARSSGALEFLRWRESRDFQTPPNPGRPSAGGRDSVRCLARLDDARFGVVYRDSGLLELERDPESGGLVYVSPEEVGPKGWNDPPPIRSIFPLDRGQPAAGAGAWLFVSDRGDFFSWSGTRGEKPRLIESIFPEWRRPSLIADSCLLQSEVARTSRLPGRGILLATDRGLYHLYFNRSSSRSEGSEATASKDRGLSAGVHRLALSGLSATPMALAYSAACGEDGKEHEYLLVTDLMGEGHLFWGSAEGQESIFSGERSEKPTFLRSGVVHARSETLLSALLPEPKSRAFFAVQIRRDDRIVLRHYSSPDRGAARRNERWADKDNQAQMLILRKLLNFGIYTRELPARDKRIAEELRGPAALRAYWDDQRDREKGAQDESVNYSKWSDAAILAELFEYLGEDENRREVLLESLRAPYSEAARVILATADEGDDGRENESETASRLWRLALLGVIHRTRGDQSPSYLGLLRWLRHRQVELQDRLSGSEATVGDEARYLRSRIANLDRDLLLARKWGLRGGVNRDRDNLVEPQRILRGQEELATKEPAIEGFATEEVERLRWERLTYRSELFGRCVSLFHEARDGMVRGRTAWATSVCRSGDSTYIAVSWMWGGVELFRLSQLAPEEEPVLTFVGGDYQTEILQPERRILEPMQKPKSDIFPSKYGYSRIVHLGKLDDQLYLISAPAFEPSKGEGGGARRAVVFAWLLGEDASARMPPSRPPFALELQRVGAESLYSLLELEEGKGRLLAGLSGGRGRPSLVRLEVQLDNSHGAGLVVHELRALELPLEAILAEGHAEARSTGVVRKPPIVGEQPGRNRVWALTRISRIAEEAYRIALGLDSGAIYQFDLGWKSNETSSKPPARLRKTQLVGRMGSPVHVLACRPNTLSGQPLRIFAGGEDGAIVAWQEIPEPGNPHFATLWATSEQGAIASIHLCRGDGLVVVVTREGRHVAFDNRDRVKPPKEPAIPTAGRAKHRPSSRVPLPGSRHGRRYLQSSSFASSVIEGAQLGTYWKEACDELGAYAALLIATDDGRLRIVSLHSPESTPERQAEYREIVCLWEHTLKGPIDFRLTEAAFKASPTLSLILVRYLLDPSLNEKSYSGEEARSQGSVVASLRRQPWFLPRHLRPLFFLNIAWRELCRPDTSLPADGVLANPLSDALERAWKLDDLSLFQETCRVVLRRVNEEICRVAFSVDPPAKQDEKEKACFAFMEILRAIERTLPRWVSADRKREARARIMVAKHLVDGETALALFREVANERQNLGAVPEQDVARRQRALARIYTFRQVLSERIRSVRELVNKRHPLVSLESVRAVNLSLARLCRLLVASRKSLCGVEHYLPSAICAGSRFEDCEVAWDDFQDYFQDLATAAERAFHTPLELNDAVAHEFSRTFALCICACPSAVLRIVAILSERRLMQNRFSGTGFFDRVQAQLGVLREIDLDAPPWAVELLRLGSQPPKDGWNPATEVGLYETLRSLKVIRSAGESKALRVHGVASIGSQNEEDLGHLERIYEVLGEMDDLANCLETAADKVNLREEWWQSLEMRLLGSRKQGKQDSRLKVDYAGGLDRAYRHSWSFWEEAFHERLPAPQARPDDPTKVQPDTIRYCPMLATWARARIKDIERRAEDGRLFEPQVTTYSWIFRRLAQAAERFSSSATIHFNIIQGILGHHLLEDLDEHALELEEIAEVLNPRKVWDFRDRGRPRDRRERELHEEEGTAEKFAAYLLERARTAEAIPASLRTLLALSRTGDEPAEEDKCLDSLVTPSVDEDRRVGWAPADPLGKPLQFEDREARYVRLVLEELDLNQRKHAWPATAAVAEELKPTFSYSAGGVRLRFPFAATEQDRTDPASNFSRLLRLKDSEMQGPSDPAQHQGVDSSGTGLYLANLAAAIISWDLKIVAIDGSQKECAWLEVALERSTTARNDATAEGKR